MSDVKTHENYPVGIILLSNLFALSVYSIGALIIFGYGVVASIIYLLYCILLEFRLLWTSCCHCFYYGKNCFLGRGRIASFFFKKDDPKKFIETQFSITLLIPDLLVSLIPLVFGTLLLLNKFNWFLLSLMIILALLAFPGNAILRGSLACKHCKQREVGCPAEQFFSRK